MCDKKKELTKKCFLLAPRKRCGRHLHCGAIVFEQSDRHCEHGQPEEAARLPFQKGHRNMQLLLLEHGALSAPQSQC